VAEGIDEEARAPAASPLAATQATAEAARQALERVRSQRDELLVLASHDFKNAVGIIDSALVMLEDSPDLAASMLGMMKRATYRLGILARAVVDVDLLERGLMPCTPAPAPWGEAMKPVLEACAPAAATKDLDVRVVGDAAETIAGDPTILERVLAAFLDHAIGNAPPGTAIDVEGVRARPGRFLVRVGQRGKVVPPGARDRFFNTLPLRYARLAVTRHGGTLRVASPWENGVGMAFEAEITA
jgi:K+-sensing histidine kinase KdpD